MKTITKCVLRNLRLLIVVALIAAAIILPLAIQSAFLVEKLHTVTDAVNMLAAGIEMDPQKPWFEHEMQIIGSVESLDQLEQVYASAFKITDSEPILLTERYYETSPFEPFEYADFVSAITEYEYGHININYAPESQSNRDIHVYYRWMPLYSPVGEQYLVIVGISKHSVLSKAHLWLSVGLWIMVIASAIYVIRSIYRTKCKETDKDVEHKNRRR